jgi:processive 1,2-diacylglycerol beta-glucosyltransferase
MHNKILILHISKVSGHKQAALAIEERLRLQEPDAEVINVDVLDFISPVMEKIIRKTYKGIILGSPEIWNFLYDNENILKNTQKIRQIIHKNSSEKLKRLMDDCRPSAIICTQAFPCGIASDYKRSYRSDIPLIGVLTDYAPHSYWIYDNVDIYAVPSDYVGKRLTEKGINSDKIRVTGIPVKSDFSRKAAKEETINKLGFFPNKPIVMIMGGSAGIGPIYETVELLAGNSVDTQFIIVAGTNEKLAKKLRNCETLKNKKNAVFSYADNVAELMSISSLIITKAGGITSAEAMSVNLPMIFLKPLPGQETFNANFLVKEGAALKAEGPKEALLLTEKILSDKNMHKNMVRSAERHARPQAAKNISDIAYSMI